MKINLEWISRNAYFSNSTTMINVAGDVFTKGLSHISNLGPSRVNKADLQSNDANRNCI